MKKIFALITLLLVFVDIADAQNYYLQVNRTDSVTKQYSLSEVENVRIGNDVWQEWATGTFTYHIIWHDWYTDDDDNVIESPVEKKNLKIYRSTFNPKRFKIANWNYTGSTGASIETFNYDSDVTPKFDHIYVYKPTTGEEIFINHDIQDYPVINVYDSNGDIVDDELRGKRIGEATTAEDDDSRGREWNPYRVKVTAADDDSRGRERGDYEETAAGVRGHHSFSRRGGGSWERQWLRGRE